MNEKITLEVGDKIYQSYYGKYSGPYVIDRVTPTQAIAKTIRFKRAVSNHGRVQEVGGGGWGNSAYYLETPEIKLKCRQEALKSKLRNFDYSTLNMDQLERINYILSETPKP